MNLPARNSAEAALVKLYVVSGLILAMFAVAIVVLT
jgi:hypothetical protein